VLHHLEQRLGDERGLVVFTGYVLPGSLAEALAEGRARRVRINGTEIDVRARVRRLHGLSGHADPSQMVDWLVGAGRAPSVVMLNHGDPGAREGMRARLQRAGVVGVDTPAPQSPMPIGV
jgi:metallo-beta-lactamase family protein